MKEEKLEEVQRQLQVLDEKIGPQSEQEDYREYATRCLSDANSLANRNWRIEYIQQIIKPAYEVEG